jgi:N-acetylneuraminate synthase
MKSKVYTIAEIGINHNGILGIAEELIKVSAAAGFDAVKFQKRTPEICVPEHKREELRTTPWGVMTYMEYKQEIEFGADEYDEIDELCRHYGIVWSASPWDIESLNFLTQYKLPWVKIPSALITDLRLVRRASKFFNKVILSTGMSTLEEVDAAYEEILRHGTGKVVVMHCNSDYPTPVEDINLRCIRTLSARYPAATIGYSGHEYGLTTTIASVVMGARVIERHVTLDKTTWGTDHMCSVEPHGMFKLIRGISDVSLALGDGKKRITEGEEKKKKDLRPL